MSSKIAARSVATITATLAIACLPAFAFATQSTNFASCFGHHHGSSLDLWSVSGSLSNEVVQVNIGVSNDSGEAPVFYQVNEVEKDGQPLQVKAYSWAIRQAIKARAKGEYYGFIKVTAHNAQGKTLYLNINSFMGLDAIVIDGYVEPLECPLEYVHD
jgi:hypothetical protein